MPARRTAAHREEDPILALRDEREEERSISSSVSFRPMAQALALLGHVRRPAQRGEDGVAQRGEFRLEPHNLGQAGAAGAVSRPCLRSQPS